MGVNSKHEVLILLKDERIGVIALELIPSVNTFTVAKFDTSTMPAPITRTNFMGEDSAMDAYTQAEKTSLERGWTIAHRGERNRG